MPFDHMDRDAISEKLAKISEELKESREAANKRGLAMVRISDRRYVVLRLSLSGVGSASFFTASACPEKTDEFGNVSQNSIEFGPDTRERCLNYLGFMT